MKRTLLNTSLALAVAGFLGTGAAVAQTPATPSAVTPPAATTTAPGAATATPAMPSAAQAAPPARTESATSAFGKLDMKHRGYISSEDVSQLQGFNFKSADKNSDGKLDATEFNAAWTTYSGAPK